MSKILNLDNIRPDRTVIINAKERKVRSMTVKQFLEAEEWEGKFKEAEGTERFNLLVDKLLTHMDDTTRDDLLSLELPQLYALLNFIRGTDQGEFAGQDEGNAPAPTST